MEIVRFPMLLNIVLRDSFIPNIKNQDCLGNEIFYIYAYMVFNGVYKKWKEIIDIIVKIVMF